MQSAEGAMGAFQDFQFHAFHVNVRGENVRRCPGISVGRTMRL
jgi:hypothetical protein